VQTHRRQLSELAASEADDHSVRCEGRPHSVDEAAASHHRLHPYRVQGEYRLLLRNVMDVRPDHGLADTGGIGRVILLAVLEERLDSVGDTPD
jgi:hypothetical protein